jgi:hypothetical protein
MYHEAWERETMSSGIQRSVQINVGLLLVNLFGLFFNPKDGADVFNRNFDRLPTAYTPLYLRRNNSS